jgi:formate dehydrogenase subunit gamma
MEVNEEDVAEIIARHAGRPEMALVALQEIQSHAGTISAAALNSLAQALGAAEGELQGVISFYTELRTTPRGRHRVCVCQGDSCAATGSGHIAASVETLLGIAPDQTTSDGQFTYEQIYCLGNCALSPSISIDEHVYGRCNPEGVTQQLERFQRSTDA